MSLPKIAVSTSAARCFGRIKLATTSWSRTPWSRMCGQGNRRTRLPRCWTAPLTASSRPAVVEAASGRGDADGACGRRSAVLVFWSGQGSASCWIERVRLRSMREKPRSRAGIISRRREYPFPLFPGTSCARQNPLVIARRESTPGEGRPTPHGGLAMLRTLCVLTAVSLLALVGVACLPLSDFLTDQGATEVIARSDSDPPSTPPLPPASAPRS